MFRLVLNHPQVLQDFVKGKMYINYVCNIIKMCNFLYKVVQPEDGVIEAKICS